MMPIKRGGSPRLDAPRLRAKTTSKYVVSPASQAEIPPSRPPALYFLPFLFTVFFCGGQCGGFFGSWAKFAPLCRLRGKTNEMSESRRDAELCLLFSQPDRESTQRGTEPSVQRLPFERCEIRLTFYLAKKKGKSKRKGNQGQSSLSPYSEFDYCSRDGGR